MFGLLCGAAVYVLAGPWGDLWKDMRSQGIKKILDIGKHTVSPAQFFSFRYAWRIGCFSSISTLLFPGCNWAKIRVLYLVHRVNVEYRFKRLPFDL